MNIPKILQEIRPGADWTLTGTGYGGLNWTDSIQSKPSLQEITNAEVIVLYKENRKAEYPPIEDQLDALWKGGQSEIDMKATVDAIKTKYPKP